ncbi:conserved protein of unknown function [Tenacibaculum sp. 190524A02b]|uniref:TMF family protein n=1 Tax=Tenacibaculum vairaonense TaxID=3137860 RepID=A0ABM9PHT8_9FLAO
MKRISILHILIAIFIVQVQKNQAQTTTNYGEGSGTQGEKNTFLGYNAGALTTSNDNSFFGYNAGAKNATGTHNMFLGRSAGFNNTTASYNMFFGSSSGLNTNTGGYNMFLGAFSGFSNRNGNSNIYIGFSSGRNNTSGGKNVFIGSSSGTNNKGNSNVFLGYSAGYDELGSNKLYIENSKNEIPLIYGDFSTNQVGINVKPTSSETTFAVGGQTEVQGNLLATGNVGIGTESPDRALDIAGGDTWQVKLSNTSETKRMFMGWYESRGAMEISTWGDGTFQNVPLSFLPQKVTFNGNVGIGTLNPSADYKLSVNGKIRAKEVTIESDWADYVFENDYKLPTLKEVETHIKEKGHLINIPSATEVHKNGVKLGEINSKLLEKIEELTLYTIAQEKKLEAQEKQLKTQEERLKKLEELLLVKNKK